MKIYRAHFNDDAGSNSACHNLAIIAEYVRIGSVYDGKQSLGGGNAESGKCEEMVTPLQRRRFSAK
jgi:hypothetical protein